MVAKLGPAGPGGASGAIGGFSSRQVARSSALVTPIRAARAMVQLARMGKASGRARVEPRLRTSRAAGVHCVTDCVAGCYCQTRDPTLLRRSNMNREFPRAGEARTRHSRVGMFR